MTLYDFVYNFVFPKDNVSVLVDGDSVYLYAGSASDLLNKKIRYNNTDFETNEEWEWLLNTTVGNVRSYRGDLIIRVFAEEPYPEVDYDDF